MHHAPAARRQTIEMIRFFIFSKEELDGHGIFLDSLVVEVKQPTEDTVADNLLRTFLSTLEALRWAVTRPGFTNLLVLSIGWVLDPGAVTQALVATGVAAQWHHERFHRFFSRGTWAPDRLGYLVFKLIIALLDPVAAVRIAIDDTLASKKGNQVFGISSHLDAVRSTKRRKVFCFGHCWVVLAVLVPLPFSNRAWALPVLFRLYRGKKACPAEDYAKKTEMARELLHLLVEWAGDRHVDLATDSAYCNETVMHGLPESVTLFGSMRPDAVLTAPPEPSPSRKKKSGRPPKRGVTLPKPSQMANDGLPWQTCSATLYGKVRKVYYKECIAQWYRASGERLLRIVIVRVEHGLIPIRVFFCTDTTLSACQILEVYARRWGIEVCFRDLKQLFGFAESSARMKAAVLGTAPFIGLLYSLLVVWFAQHVHESPLATPPRRPWYRHKRGLSFADILRTARRVHAPLDVVALVKAIEARPAPNLAGVLDPSHDIANLTKSMAAPVAPSVERLRLAG